MILKLIVSKIDNDVSKTAVGFAFNYKTYTAVAFLFDLFSMPYCHLGFFT